MSLDDDEVKAREDSALVRESRDRILEGDGYVLLPDFFDPAPLLELVVPAVEAQYAAGAPVFSGGYRPDLAGVKAVQDLMLEPRLIEIAWQVLGQKPAYGSLGVNSVPPGSEGMDPHFDYPYFAMHPESLPKAAFPALCVQMIWYLTDVTEDGGPTMVVPGSQRKPSSPTPEYHDFSVPVLPRAGTLFVGHGALWHGVGRNTSSSIRHVILGSFVPFWVHPMLRPASEFGTSPAMREILRSDFPQRLGDGYSNTVDGAAPVSED